MFSPTKAILAIALVAALGGTWLAMQPPEQGGSLPGAAQPSAEAAEPTVVRTTDAVGDAGGGPDIVAVTTISTDEEVVVEVELADDWDPGSMRLSGFLETGGGPTVSSTGKVAPLPDPTACNGWFSEAQFEVTERAEMVELVPVAGSSAVLWYHDSDGMGEALEYEVAGPMLTLTIPLVSLDDPDMLSLGLLLRGWDQGSDEVRDVFPDDEQTCHLAFLKPSACGPLTECTAAQIAAAAMSSPAPTEVIHVVGDDFAPYLSRRYMTELVGGVDQLRGGVVSMRSEMDDQRVSGETTYAFSIDAVDGAGSQWGTMRVENAEGAWEGPCTGGTWDDGGSAIGGCWLTGSGAYEGYTYYRQHYWAEAIGSGVHGLIYPSLEGTGSLPPTDFAPLPSPSAE